MGILLWAWALMLFGGSPGPLGLRTSTQNPCVGLRDPVGPSFNAHALCMKPWEWLFVGSAPTDISLGLRESIWASTLLQTLWLQSPWRIAKDHAGAPYNHWQQLSVLFGIFHCFQCIESTEKPAPVTAMEQSGPLPAAQDLSLGTASSPGLVMHTACSSFDSIKQPMCSQSPKPRELHEQQCVFINSLQKKKQDEQGWDYPAAALVMPDSCSVKTAGRSLGSLQGMPFDTRQESVLAAMCCLRERSWRDDFL